MAANLAKAKRRGKQAEISFWCPRCGHEEREPVAKPFEGEVKRGAEETCLTVYLVEAMKRSALGFHERIDSTLIEAGNLSAARAAADTWLREKGFDSKTISDARIVVGDLIVAE
jgi:hypothetical protein